MARPLTEIINTPIELPFDYRAPETIEMRFCPCGCGPLIKDRHAYIESGVTGDWYCDIVGMVKAEGATWSEDGKYIRDDWGELYTVSQWKMDREVIEHS